MKRFAALLLFVLLALTPFSASMAAGDHPDSVWIQGVELSAGAPYYVNGEATARSTAPAAWNAYYNAADGELTLKDLQVAGHNKPFSPLDHAFYGIYAFGAAADDTLTIKLEGNSSVSTAENDKGDCYGVSTNLCNVTFTGDGTLTATGGATSFSSYGIHASQGSITVTGGSITGVGGASGTGSYSCGVSSSDDITVDGGSVTGTSTSTGTGTQLSFGVYSSDGSITVENGSITGTGGTANGDYRRSFGVYAAAGGITAGDSGRITGTGGTVDGRNSDSYGVCTLTGSITANSGGTITGTGNTATNGSSCGGVLGGSDITVNNGGTVTGTGGSGALGSSGVSSPTGIVTVQSGGYLRGVGGSVDTSNLNLYSYGIHTPRVNLDRYATAFVQGQTNALSVQPTIHVASVAAVSTSFDGSSAGEYKVGYSWVSEYKFFRLPKDIPTTEISITQATFPFGQAPDNETVSVTSDLDSFNASNSFGGAAMDGAPIDLGTVGDPGAQGSVENGSIVIRLNKAYLDSLSVGAHTLRVSLAGVYAGQSVETTITILPSGGGDAETGGDPGVPKTGDSAQLMLWLMLVLTACAGLAVRAVVRRRRQNG